MLKAADNQPQPIQGKTITMKKILLVLAATLGFAFFSHGSAQAGGGPNVAVTFGFPAPVVVVPARGYYYDPAPVYYEEYAPRRYYRRNVRAVYRGETVRGGYRGYYRGNRYCD